MGMPISLTIELNVLYIEFRERKTIELIHQKNGKQTNQWTNQPIGVWEGTAGTSRDVPIFGLRSHSVTNVGKKLAQNSIKMNIFEYFH